MTLRDAHERPEGMDEAAVVICWLGSERVLQAIDLVTGQHEGAGPGLHAVDDYRPDNVSSKVVQIILSYVDYVYANVWRRP